MSDAARAMRMAISPRLAINSFVTLMMFLSVEAGSDRPRANDCVPFQGPDLTGVQAQYPCQHRRVVLAEGWRRVVQWRGPAVDRIGCFGHDMRPDIPALGSAPEPCGHQMRVFQQRVRGHDGSGS